MDLISQLKRDEGVRYTIYNDSEGNPTFGVGHKGTTKLTDVAVMQILKDDIAITTAELLHEFPWMTGLSITRLNVFINMAFNMGVGKAGGLHGLASFHDMLEAAQEALSTLAFKPVADEMRKSKWHTQVGARAERLAIQMETGIPQ